MLLWDGVCMVHDAMRAERVLELRAEHPDAVVIAHPECNGALLKVADFVGSTKAMLNYIENLYACLRDETPEIVMDAETIERAKTPIVRMLEMSKQLGIIK